MNDADITRLDLRGVSEAIGARQVSSVEVTEAYLRRIERYDSVLQSYITVTADRALDQARRADQEFTHGQRRGPLHGVPIALKDLIAVAGVRMTAGSSVLAEHVPARDAFVTERLDAAGAVTLGKLSTHEFAFGRAAFDGPFPTGRNPWDIERVPAGSSSGSAVATAAGLCAGSLGSDTGGSIRGPAAFCGLVGLKPTYGLVSRRGVIPMCWSLDHVGPLTWTTWDAAIVLQAIAGHDPEDASTSTAKLPSYTRSIEAGVRGTRLGLLRRYYLDWDGLQEDVRRATLAALAELRRQGAEIIEVDAPTLDLAQAAWSAFLAEMYDSHAATIRDRLHDYRETTRPRLLMGALVTGADLVRAQRLRARLAREVAELLRQVDALVFPGSPETAPRFEDVPTTSLLVGSARYTCPWNLIGLPALVLPSGFNADGLPMSLQIVGRPFDDATVLRIGRAYERATDWHTRRPDPSRWVRT